MATTMMMQDLNVGMGVVEAMAQTAVASVIMAAIDDANTFDLG